MLQNDRLLRAIYRQPLDRTPIWIMRQAGRYLPEYREIRKKAGDFLTLVKTPELASAVTLQPIQRFDLDAAIIFSDILTIPDAYGLGLRFVENEGPKFDKPVRSLQAIRSLPHIDPETELGYVTKAIRLVKAELANKIPLIGFSGSPWSLAAYMVEGEASKQFNQVRRLLFEDPTLLHALLSHLTQSVIDYLNAQIAAGVDVVMLFDTWGGLLSRDQYLTFSLAYLEKIIQGLTLSPHQTKVPVILFSKNGGMFLEEIAETGCDVIGVDWIGDLKAARQKVGHKVALQGNLDPAALYGDFNSLQKSVQQVLAAFGAGTGHIFNLGHGISPDVDPEKVAFLIQVLQEHSPSYHIDRENK